MNNFLRIALALALCAAGGLSAAIVASDADRSARAIAKENAAYWTEYETRIGRAMRKWGCQELGRVAGGTVFYPFSGPDLPTAVHTAVDALSSVEETSVVAEQLEAGVLERSRPTRRKFRRLSDQEVLEILPAKS